MAVSPERPHVGQLSPFSPQVVGSQARILYSDQKGRVAIAMAFNQAIARGKIKVGCPVLGRGSPASPPGQPRPGREEARPQTQALATRSLLCDFGQSGALSEPLIRKEAPVTSKRGFPTSVSCGFVINCPFQTMTTFPAFPHFPPGQRCPPRSVHAHFLLRCYSAGRAETAS